MSPNRYNSLPTTAQRRYLLRGVSQPGGKLPLFDEVGQLISPKMIRSCINQDWARPWFANPIKPDWIVCRLTERGKDILKLDNKLHSSG